VRETKQNGFAGFRSSYRPPIELVVPNWHSSQPVNDVSSKHVDDRTSDSLANQQRRISNATRLPSSSRLPTMLTFLAAILLRVSAYL